MKQTIKAFIIMIVTLMITDSHYTGMWEKSLTGYPVVWYDWFGLALTISVAVIYAFVTMYRLTKWLLK
jgi:NO-binding membrane sensor protein with MHYT domain